MKLIIIPESDENSPASRFRVYQIIPVVTTELKKLYPSVDVTIVKSVIPYHHPKFSYLQEKYYLIKNLYRIFRAIISADKKDIFYIQRGIFERGIFDRLVFYIYFFFNKIGYKNFIFDFDDAIHLNAPNLVPKMIKMSRMVITGSHYLLDYALTLNTQSYLVPTGVIISNYRINTDLKNPPRIILGWIGSATTVDYLKILSQPLEILGKKYQITLKVMAPFAPPFPFTNIDLEFIPWAKESEEDFFRSIDIGLMPLHDGEWEKGKCGLKILRYMSYGIPSVASAVGENNYIVSDGINGFLARNNEEWIEKLEKLFTDAKLRNKISTEAYRFVQNNYSVEKIAKKLAKLIADNFIVDKA